MTPDPQYPPRLGDDIFISGDGMISSFRFENGHVDYKSRYVRTERFLAERKARRGLFGAYRNRFTDDPAVAGVDRTVANTTPGLARRASCSRSKEDGLPYEIDPVTLDTRGRYDWDGRLKTQTVTAHPKVDPKTGELLFFGYEASGDATRDMAFCVADSERRAGQRGVVRGALRGHGPRLRHHRRLRGLPDLPDPHGPGSDEGRRPALDERHLQGRLCGRDPAQGPGSRTCAGSSGRAASSST